MIRRMNERLNSARSLRWKSVCLRWRRPMRCCRVFNRTTMLLSSHHSRQLWPNTRRGVMPMPSRRLLPGEIDHRELMNYIQVPHTPGRMPGILRGRRLRRLPSIDRRIRNIILRVVRRS